MFNKSLCALLFWAWGRVSLSIVISRSLFSFIELQFRMVVVEDDGKRTIGVWSCINVED